MKKKNKLTVTSLVAVCLVTIAAPQVFAYSKIGYKLVAGVKDRYYYVGASSLGSNIDAAVSNWNNIDPLTYFWQDQTDVNFIKSSSNSTTQLDFYSDYYGNTGWAGMTYYFDSAGAINSGGYPTKDYTWCQAKLNLSASHNNSWTTIAGHEMGHALGLMHYTNSLMDGDITNGSNLPTGITLDDIDGIRDIY
ncbi:matrixin family metalloprotease [Paenibacillus ferrarius]|uniref:matrixin family metalloprotease n=1 Tax=Paenibacillus ferrarius TaxID=1469647 RepID=UPI003D2CDECD